MMKRKEMAAVSRQQLAFRLINTPDVAKNQQGLALKERGAGLTVEYESSISLATFHPATYLTATLISTISISTKLRGQPFTHSDRPSPTFRRRTPNRA